MRQTWLALTLSVILTYYWNEDKISDRGTDLGHGFVHPRKECWVPLSDWPPQLTTRWSITKQNMILLLQINKSSCLRSEPQSFCLQGCGVTNYIIYCETKIVGIFIQILSLNYLFLFNQLCIVCIKQTSLPPRGICQATREIGITFSKDSQLQWCHSCYPIYQLRTLMEL